MAPGNIIRLQVPVPPGAQQTIEREQAKAAKKKRRNKKKKKGGKCAKF